MADTRNNPQNQTATNAMQRDGNKSTSATTTARRSSETSRSTAPSSLSFMRRFVNDMERLFGIGTMSSMVGPEYGTLMEGFWAPQMDVFERDGQLFVHAELPGLKLEDVRVHVEDGVLTIAGERNHAHEHEKGGVYQCERSYGSFRRSVILPDGVDPQSVRASFEGGLLEVTMPMPKQKATAGRVIPIQSKSGGGSVQH